jgi:hypothetical protein
MKPKQFAAILLTVGTLLTLYVGLFKQEGGFDFTICMFITGPWLIAGAFLFIFSSWSLGIAIAAVPMFVLELLIFYTVFYDPHGSTDAVIYAVKPFLQLFLFLPIGLLIGRFIDTRTER